MPIRKHDHSFMRIEDLSGITAATYISERDFAEVVADIVEHYYRSDMLSFMRRLRAIAEYRDSIYAIYELMGSAIEARTGRLSVGELQRRASMALRGYNEAVEREEIAHYMEAEEDEFEDEDTALAERHIRELEDEDAAILDMLEEDEWEDQSTDDNDDRDMYAYQSWAY